MYRCSPHTCPDVRTGFADSTCSCFELCVSSFDSLRQQVVLTNLRKQDSFSRTSSCFASCQTLHSPKLDRSDLDHGFTCDNGSFTDHTLTTPELNFVSGVPCAQPPVDDSTMQVSWSRLQVFICWGSIAVFVISPRSQPRS